MESLKPARDNRPMVSAAPGIQEANERDPLNEPKQPVKDSKRQLDEPRQSLSYSRIACPWLGDSAIRTFDRIFVS